ncbi:hypothetical protein [Borreliella bavariensis]|uniref:hypothetical protein n=1 Tax=Borreliella bavariensis TaxID=664662 RepID=UPI001C002DC8|nr:hypothetical protein [Borreliella bavariensis]
MLQRKFFKTTNHENYHNKPYYRLIIFITTIEYIDRYSGVGYYNRYYLNSMTNISIKEFISLNKMEIDSTKVQKYIDILEQELKLITNKYKKENNIFKLYYTLNYPLEKCYTMIKDHYE